MRWEGPVLGINVAAGEDVRGGERGGCLDSSEEEDLVGRGDEKDAVTEAPWQRLDGLFSFEFDCKLFYAFGGVFWVFWCGFDGGVLTWRLGWLLGGA